MEAFDVDAFTEWRTLDAEVLTPLRPHGLRSAWRLSVDHLGLPGCLPILLHYHAAAVSPTSFAATDVALPPHIFRAVRKRQAEYLFGRLAARLAMGEYGPPYTPLHSGEARQPQWPPGLVGSISHDDRFAIAVCLPAVRCTGIGIDIERELSADALDAVLNTALDDQETALIRRSGVPMAMAATLAFSAKESFYKAAYAEVGHFFDFAALRILAFQTDRRQLLMEVTGPLSSRLDRGYRITARHLELPGQTVLTCVHY